MTRPYDYESDVDHLLDAWHKLAGFDVLTRDQHRHALERMARKAELAIRLLPAPEAVQGVPV